MQYTFGSIGVRIYSNDQATRLDLNRLVESGKLAVDASGDLDALASDVALGRSLTLAELARADAVSADAALTHLHRVGAHGAVIVHMDQLDEACAALDGSALEILVDPAPFDILFALNQALLRAGAMQVAELSVEDRLTLTRMADQIAVMAQNIDALVQRGTGPGANVAAPAIGFGNMAEDFSGGLVDRSKPVPPDPRLVRQTIRNRRLRARFFDAGLFADPAWDILLDLFAARIEGQQVSVSSLCIAAAVPPTTALRWVRQLTDSGLCHRVEDSLDRRRAFIVLGDASYLAMCRYFAELRAQGEVKAGGVSA